MFIHFLHDQTLKLYKVQERVRPRKKLIGVMRHALRWAAYLSQDPLIIPTSDLAQSPIAADLFADLQLLVAADALYFVGSSADIDVLQAQHLEHFNKTRLYQEWRRESIHRRLKCFEPSFHVRTLNTTVDILAHWNSDVIALAGDSGAPSRLPIEQLLQAHRLLKSKVPPKDYEATLAAVPDRLGNHAFLWNVVENLNLFGYETTPAARAHLELALAWHWVMSYVQEYRTNLVGRIPGVGYVDCGLRRANPEALVDLVAYDWAMKVVGLDRAFRELTLAELIQLRDEPRVILLRDTLLRRLSHIPSGSGEAKDRQLAELTRVCESVRDGALSAQSAYKAVTAAADRAIGWVLQERTDVALGSGSFGQAQGATTGVIVPGAAPRRLRRKSLASRPTVAVVVALVEELGVLLKAVKTAVGPLSIDDDSETGLLSYTTERQTPRGIDIQLVFALVGKGQERAAAGTVMVVNRHQPCIVVNVGIAGALSTDVGIGDVVIGDQVVSYLANAKAVPDSEGGFEIAPGGDGFRSDELLADRAKQLELSEPTAFAAAQERLRRLAEPSLASLMSDIGFRVFAGPIASGPVVGAAAAFKHWLRRWKRDYLAVEMESSGVAVATERTGMVRRVRFLALRGISDGADEGKSRLEEDTKGAARRLALVATLEMLLVLVDTLPPVAFSLGSGG